MFSIVPPPDLQTLLFKFNSKKIDCFFLCFHSRVRGIHCFKRMKQ